MGGPAGKSGHKPDPTKVATLGRLPLGPGVASTAIIDGLDEVGTG